MELLTIQEIEDGIRQDFYSVHALRFKAGAAFTIKQLKDKSERARLTAMFSLTNSGRDVTIWSRIAERFPQVFDNSIQICADGITAVSYMCQLPLAVSRNLFAARIDQLNEPNIHLSVLRDVNELKPRREKRKPAPQPCATCARLRELLIVWENADVDDLLINEFRAALDGAGEGAG